jgi:Rod binding domain-containing protein
MNKPLTPDTNLALMHATQGDSTKIAKDLKHLGDAKKAEKFEHAAQDFEAVFIAEMMKPMFEGISTEAPFGGGKGEEVFRDLLLQEYGKIIAKTGSVGIADSVKQAMIEMQEAADNATTTPQ